MAGLDPAIHVFVQSKRITGTKPGDDSGVIA
jgi:hypothetical protein